MNTVVFITEVLIHLVALKAIVIGSDVNLIKLLRRHGH